MPNDSSPRQRLLAAVFAPLNESGKAQRVEDRIVEGITAGVLADGDRLPSEAELAASMGVATVTAREALVGLRSRGLVSTRRGREGGTFITVPVGQRGQLVRDRLRSMSRVELRDLAIHYQAIAATAAELAADFAGTEDVDALRGILRGSRHSGLSGAVVGEFLLELAALSQSATLTREFVRLYKAFGPLLSLLHEDGQFDAEMIQMCERIADAVAAADPPAAREAVKTQVQAGLAALIDEHSRLADRSGTATPPNAQKRTG
ncbi:GntR family transcriptional regulator [Arthrobacter sp. JZ12]|uniref:winged helix-turn-helix domain-containing protein n=1 Tax=Arthrobacter sp. JZ12 TaxID=2654190 RepID=UPI002B47EF39|nr:winged helix-turn-helix domain-containing protein [Arthrobacter sp. JZ12]WRH23923.1 GntR family transcriptional regulator [Arthrobacter sp. JZ12]